MIAKTDAEIVALRTAGRYLAEVLEELSGHVAPGVTAAELDVLAEKLIQARGAKSAFMGYKPEGNKYPFPAVLCVSVNEEVVHGIPTEAKVLEEGDIVTLDLGLSYEGYFVDSAITVPVGEASADDSTLIAATREALGAAIASVHVGGHIGDIGAAVEKVAHKTGFTIIEDLGGHAVGKAVHEQPYIPNNSREGKGEKIVEGMVLALEPMFSRGSGAIVLDPHDQWTYRTSDGSRVAHAEHTILVTKNGAEILTSL